MDMGLKNASTKALKFGQFKELDEVLYIFGLDNKES